MAGRGYSARTTGKRKPPCGGCLSHGSWVRLVLAVAMFGVALVIVLAVTMTSGLVEFVGVLGDRVVHGTAP